METPVAITSPRGRRGVDRRSVLEWTRRCFPWRRALIATALSVGWTQFAAAAPPTLTGLFPAGVQRGGTRNLTVRGNLKTRPIQAWCSREDLKLSLAEDKEELTVTIPAEAAPGPCWVRLYNAEGSSELYPLLIGLLPEMAETEPNNRLSEANVVEALPMTVDGRLHKSGEVDLLAVDLTAGQQLVAVVESREPLGTPADMVLQVVSAEGYVLRQNDDYAGMDPFATYRAESDATVYVRLFAFPAAPDSTINFAGGEDYVYRLTLTTGPYCSHLFHPLGKEASSPPRAIGWNLPTEVSPTDMIPGLHRNRPRRSLVGVEAPSSADSQPLSEAHVPDWSQAVVGRLADGSPDPRWKYVAKKGEAVVFEVQAQSIGSRLDPVLQLTDADGKTLKEQDDISRDDRDCSLEWTPPADMDCWVQLRDRFGHNGDDYVFRLTARSKTPSVELTIEADHFTLTRKQPLEIPVKINRTAGFDQTLSIRIEGLPEGVTCEPVVSEAKGDSSKQVTLKLATGDSPGGNGPIRIVARVGDAVETDAFATVKTRVPDVRSDQLWLTVEPPPG